MVSVAVRKRDADLERELQSDLELEEEEQRADGRSPLEARYAARRALGNVALIQRIPMSHGELPGSSVSVRTFNLHFANSPGTNALQRYVRSPWPSELALKRRSTA